MWLIVRMKSVSFSRLWAVMIDFAWSIISFRLLVGFSGASKVVKHWYSPFLLSLLCFQSSQNSLMVFVSFSILIM